MSAALLRWCSVTVLLLPLLLAVRAPAWLIAEAVGEAGAGRWRLQIQAGSLWAGTGGLEFRDEAQWRDLGPVSWQVEPAELLHGGLGFRLALPGGGARLRLAPRGWELADLRLGLPASALLGSLPLPLHPAQWAGQMDLAATHWGCGWNSRVCTGEARLRWSGAASAALLGGLVLGTYEARVSATGEGLQAHALSVSGPLLLEGALSLAPAGQANLVADFWGESAQQALLEPVLGSLGATDPRTGRHHLSLELSAPRLGG